MNALKKALIVACIMTLSAQSVYAMKPKNSKYELSKYEQAPMTDAQKLDFANLLQDMDQENFAALMHNLERYTPEEQAMIFAEEEKRKLRFSR